MPAHTLDDVHYIVTITGIYYTQAPKGENTFNYEIDIPMTHAQLEDQKVSALSLFKHNYAHILMPRKYPEFAGLATHEIKRVQCSEPSRLLENIKLMNAHQLIKYIRANGLPIKPELYEDAGSLRNAIEAYRKDQEGFIKIQKITEQRKGPHLVKQAQADKMILQYESQLAAGSLKPIVSAKAKPVAEDDEYELDGI